MFIVGVNQSGTRAGAWMQNLFTMLKLAAIALLVVAGLVLAGTLSGVLAGGGGPMSRTASGARHGARLRAAGYSARLSV